MGIVEVKKNPRRKRCVYEKNMMMYRIFLRISCVCIYMYERNVLICGAEPSNFRKQHTQQSAGPDKI